MKEIKALYVLPDRRPVLISIEDKLDNYQALVDGYIEAISLDEHTDIICNESAKLNGMLANRMLKYGDFGIMDDRHNLDFDLIYGNFLIVSSDNEQGTWESLTQEQIDKYQARFNGIEIYLANEMGVTR